MSSLDTSLFSRFSPYSPLVRHVSPLLLSLPVLKLLFAVR